MKEKFRQKAISRNSADGETSQVPFEPFILTTRDLILVPTPIAITIPAYRALYQRLHASPEFCEMGFAHHFIAREWSDDETRDVIQSTDVGLSWKARGLGDFAVGVRPSDYESDGTRLRSGDHEVAVWEGDDYAGLGADGAWSGIEWAGYAGARDAIITSLRDVVSGDAELPPWQEMVEVRYGIAPESWGKGVARQAIDAVMLWAARERGVRRFIAETEKTNTRSGSDYVLDNVPTSGLSPAWQLYVNILNLQAVLEKVGFRKSGTDYWKEPSEVEWERIASS